MDWHVACAAKMYIVVDAIQAIALIKIGVKTENVH